jgi:hypothetical protein
VHVSNRDEWPATLQPFFLSALPAALTPQEASYIGNFPVAVINHKQGSQDRGSAESKQLKAIAAIKAANASCLTHFYLNSQIDFPELAMHELFVANASWWLRQADGQYVWHNKSAGGDGGDHVIDFTVEAARASWLSTASAALSNDAVDGIFVDKAKSDNVTFKGVSVARMAEWQDAHELLLAQLRNSTTKNVILNNAHALTAAGVGMGQLFERWGEFPSHDGLNLKQDMRLLRDLSTQGLTTLARAGGAPPGTHPVADPVVCGSGLAEFLISVRKPNTGFFSCVPDFRSTSTTGWMALLADPIYSRPLGAPTGLPTRNSTHGLVKRQFASGAVAWLDESELSPTHLLGCVRWSGGAVSGRCPPGAGAA